MIAALQVSVIAALASLILLSYGVEWRWAIGGVVMAGAVWLLGRASLGGHARH